MDGFAAAAGKSGGDDHCQFYVFGNRTLLGGVECVWAA